MPEPESEFISIQFLLRRDAQQQEELTALRGKIEQIAAELQQIEKTIPQSQLDPRPSWKAPLATQLFDFVEKRFSSSFIASLAGIAILAATLNFVEVDRLQQAIDLYRQINSTAPAR